MLKLLSLKTFLTTKLSTKELVFARNLFLKDPRLKIDQESNIIVTKDHFNRVYYDLMLMIKCVTIFRRTNLFSMQIVVAGKNTEDIILMLFYTKIRRTTKQSSNDLSNSFVDLVLLHSENFR